MNEIIGKLTNLTYELFGVIIPGLVMATFLLALWLALGELAPLWSHGFVAELKPAEVPHILDSVTTWAMLFPALACVYFLGHLLLWVGRSGTPLQAGARWPGLQKAWACLRFRIPKPASSFDPELAPLFDKTQERFTAPGQALQWRQFYPLAKSYIAQRLSYSLVATYQNKYTLHRSVTTAATCLFWLSFLSLLGGRVAFFLYGVSSPWITQALLLALSIILMWGFTGSYEMHWKMFGNTIVTESYTLLFGPKDDRTTGK